MSGLHTLWMNVIGIWHLVSKEGRCQPEDLAHNPASSHVHSRLIPSWISHRLWEPSSPTRDMDYIGICPPGS